MIDHSGHPHPSTPKARALCRANGGTGVIAKVGADAPKAPVVARAATAKSAPALTSAKVPVPKKVTKSPVERADAILASKQRAKTRRKARGTTPASLGPSNKPVKPKSTFNELFNNVNVSQDTIADEYATGVDSEMNEIARQQGFNGKPRVVSSTEMDELIGGGAEPLYRGVRPYKGTASSEFLNRLRGKSDEEFKFGSGVYGNGIYFSDKRDTAEQYASGYRVKDPNQGIIRGVIHPDSKIIDYDQARAQSHKELIEYQKTDEFKNPIHSSPEWLESRRKMGLMSDPGRWAAMKGYDVLRVDGKDDGKQITRQMVILNRTALILEDIP